MGEAGRRFVLENYELNNYFLHIEQLLRSGGVLRRLIRAVLSTDGKRDKEGDECEPAQSFRPAEGSGRKLLVLAEAYPDPEGGVSLQYVHTRDLYYQKAGFLVEVINFRAKAGYVYEGIKVRTLQDYERSPSQYDGLILHAPNIKHHFRFLKKYGRQFSFFVFFFHGHEVLRKNSAYPKPYPYVRRGLIRYSIQGVYDEFKLFVWRRYYRRVKTKSQYVFVSGWMLDEFLKSMGWKLGDLGGRYSITYNGVGRAFQDNDYLPDSAKQYDFITIRNRLDGSKYCVDVVNALAKSHPDMSFLVVGKGEYFKHYEKAPNVIWEDRTMDHQQIIAALQTARCALMPTRTDAQGLMMCEMATFGIPVITSDIPVCHEVFDGFENVALISNEDVDTDLRGICERLEKGLPYRKNAKYFNENTCAHEVELIQKMIGNQ